jgi:osmotically-inducible protein OsmY
MAISLGTALQGCAVYEKCGFHGCPGDGQLAADVQANFAQHPSIMPPNTVNIRCLDGVAYLSGLVDTDMQRQLAESVAAATPGVKKVVNSIGLAGNGNF